MVNSFELYKKLSNLCIQKGLLTQEQSDIICRRGHRKEKYWMRHIYDLASFVLWKMKDEDVNDFALQELLDDAKDLFKNNKSLDNIL